MPSKLWTDHLRRRVLIVVAFIGVIWLVAGLDAIVFGGRLQSFGIVPRTEHGLTGILAAPLLHAGFQHLVANSLGILVFGTLVMLRSECHFWVVTLVGALASGAGTWLFGRPLLHIGASGIVFAYFGYLLLTGWFERRIGALLISIVVFLVWGPTLYGILPLQAGISWEGHLFGLMGGVLAAWLLARWPRACSLLPGQPN
jgi:membrane associated rhomboid family serine protease